jgi:phosphoribosyl 1,2-cyclic phosphodiesterase
VRLHLLGVRGSTPAPGPNFVRYGGNTSCVAVYLDADGGPSALPELIFDAGTGLAGLGRLLGGGAYTGDIVLSHLHWDHVQGLPFCPAVDRDDSVVRLHLPVGDDPASPVEVLARGFSPPHFPIDPHGLRGSWEFRAVRPGTITLAGGAALTAAPVPHKGGAAVGFRLEVAGRSLAYLPDHLLDPNHLAGSVGALVAGVDVLVHDGQYTPDEAAVASAYGHAVIDDVLAWADACGVGRVVLTHHAPSRSDAQLDSFAARYARTGAGRPVHIATEGEVIEVRAADPATVASLSRSGR